MLTIPVIGAGEATLQAAARGGRSFAIVTVWPRSLAHLYDERLRALALAEQCLAIRHVSAEEELARVGHEDGVMQRMHRGETSILDHIREACDRVVREHGVECVVLGCTCMAPIGPALESACSVPVLESSRIGYRAAVAAARGRTPHTARATITARRDLVPALVDAWLEGGPKAELPDAGGDCPVCIDS